MSFRLKTVLGIAFIEGVLLLLLVYTSVDYLKSSNEAEIVKRADAIVTLFAAATKDAVISTDLSTLQVLANELLESNQVLYVNIYDRNSLLVQVGEISSGEVGFEVEDEENPPGRIVGLSNGVLAVQAEILESGYHFGHVELGISVHKFDQFLIDATTRFFSIAGLEMVLVALFSWLLGHYLTSNLSELKTASNRILQGETGIQIPVTSSDEIGQTTRAFNRMIEKVEGKAKELEGANTRLNTILSAAVDGFIIIDVYGVITQVNPAICRLFGYMEDEIVGKNVSIFMPSYERHTHNAFLKRFIEGKREAVERNGREFMALHKDGNLFPIELSISKMTIEKEIMLLGLVKDLSDIKQKEIEAKRTESILLATLEASQDALITIDIAGKIQEFNEAASQLFGHDKESVIGEQLAEVIFTDIEKACFKEGLEEFRQTGDGPAIKKSIELMSMKLDGSTLPIELKMIPVQLGDDIFLTAFIHDISKRMEYELQLKNAKEEAESGSKAKSRFLATMSHEIRSPLNAVLGSVELLLDSMLNKEQRLYAQTAREAGTALLSTINDILDFSKIEAGQMALETESFSPAKLVSQVMQILAPKAAEKGVNLATFINRNVPEIVKGDAQRLRQVLHNLVDNAIKFSDSGCISVEMWIPDSHHQEVQLYCTVTDEGIGVSLSAQEKLFQEFSQVHDQHNTSYKGTGLGLAICSELITMMGGKIELSSRLGHGSCFRFDVRLQQDPCELNHFYHLPQHARVLLIHSDKTVVELARKQYCQYGVHCDNLDNISILVGSAEVKGRFNLILIDETSLPEIDQSLTYLLKRDFLFEEGILALLVSSLGSNMSEELSKLGLEQVIYKPLNRDILLGLLSKSYLNKKESSADILLPDITPKNKLLLLAEDSMSNQLVAGAMLTKAGYEVEFANNGVEAVSMAAEKNYGLILMDMRMPEMDGVEAAQLILLSQPDTIILAMTANVQQEDMDSCLRVGMKDFVPKPVNKNDLIRLIEQWLPAITDEERVIDSVDSEVRVNELKSCEHPDEDISFKDDRAEVIPLMAEMESEAEKLKDNLFDEGVISELFDVLGQESVEGMYSVYLSETVERLEVLKTLMKNRNYHEIDNQAHTLKSSSGSFGAQALYKVAKNLEKSAREKDENNIEFHFLAVQQVGDETVKAFKDRFIA
ncbi:PAS domain S-box protein [Shewanella woodyi]|uniref:Sensor protein FixL n=1 Tax=Shewanella woodyi (strain ATCC 51908 / MS32) TaxID=392500 RepID=B1KMJ1_SHEWM|nr:PAS domain S-box protein [Shewanella woodyi]ACA85989.1 multi-sensor hybrid histidine kinase [Shewanella woodyi ATCC 51908]